MVVQLTFPAGYTQSGPLFHAKTRALEKLLTKALAPISIAPILIYPTGPNRLRLADIPGFNPDSAKDDDEEPEMWSWFRKHDASGEYRHFDEGMETVSKAIKEAGGIDAVCGFSQGGAMTGFVTSALEPDRTVPDGAENDWARKLREANGGKGVKFGIIYSGFFGPVDMLKWLYEPKIKTPTLHVIGSLDTVVEESRSQGLVDRCENPQVITHPGGHHVPVSKEWAMPIAGFIKQYSETDTPRPGL